MVSFGSQESESESAPTKVDMWTPEQKALWNQLYGMTSSKLSSGQGVPSYPGQMYAPTNAQEQSYLDAVGSAYNPANLESRVDAVNKVLSGKPSYEINPDITEKFYQDSVKAPMMKEFNEITMPGIKESFTGSGYWGSARANAMAKGYTDLATTLASKRAELAYQDEAARRASLESAAGRQATLAGDEADSVFGATSAMGSAGTYARNIENEKIAGELQRWLMGEEVNGVRNDAYNPYIQLALSLLGLNQYALGNTSSSDSSGWGFGVSLPTKK